MTLLHWDDKFFVHVKKIDEQHKKLVNMVNDFYSHVNNNAHTDKLQKLLNGLADYTVYHFETEEKYMMDINYSDIDSHKKEHAEFVEKILDVKNRYESGKMVMSLEITNFVKNWLVDHIMGTDQKYAQ